MSSIVSSWQQPLAPLASCESCGVWGTLNEGGSGCYWAGVWVVFQRSIHCYSCGRLGGSNPFGDPALQLPLPGLCPLSVHSQIKSSRCATRILFTVDSSPVRIQDHKSLVPTSCRLCSIFPLFTQHSQENNPRHFLQTTSCSGKMAGDHIAPTLRADDYEDPKAEHIRQRTLGNVRLRHHETNEIILIPTPSNDPNDPLNW